MAQALRTIAPVERPILSYSEAPITQVMNRRALKSMNSLFDRPQVQFVKVRLRTVRFPSEELQLAKSQPFGTLFSFLTTYSHDRNASYPHQYSQELPCMSFMHSSAVPPFSGVETVQQR